MMMSEGAEILDLQERNIKVPLLLRKSDGATTYHTRDLAAALYRLRTFSPEKILYVVGAPQSFHFKQLFTAIDMLGYDSDKFMHVPFGNMTYEGTMMSTRHGNFIPLEEVLQKAVDLAEEIIEEKNPDLENKKEVAKQVGIGAVIFGDLSNDRVRDVDFRWDKVLSFEGDTSPYLQYVHARICSIQRKVNIPVRKNLDFSVLQEEIEHELTKKLGDFPEKIKEAARTYKPSYMSGYLLEFAQLFNKFYNTCHIAGTEEKLRDARLLLADSTRIVICKGLALLGIASPSQM